MRLVARIRNAIESNRRFESMYNKIGTIPAYRSLIERRVTRRVDYVKRHKQYGLMIELSSVCNARCVFCPHSGMKREKRLMGDDLFDLVVNRVLEDGIQPPTIDLFNVGEPLTDRKLFVKVRKLKSLWPDAKVRITTNLSLATDSTIDEMLASGLDSVHISLNADSEDSYFRIMGLNYQTAVRNIDTLLEKRAAIKSPLNVMLSMVLCTENRGDEGAFVKRWSKKVDSICLQRAVDWGGGVVVGDPYRCPSKQLYPCNDLFERITILSNGEVALCCQDYQGIIHSNVREHSILEIFVSRTFEAFRENHLRGEIASLKMCRNCFAVHSNGANWLFKKFE